MKYAVIKDAVGTIQQLSIFCDNQIIPSDYTEISFSEYESARSSITDIESIKTHICDRIDKIAGNIRLKYITDVPGQAITYQLKSEEAKQIKSLGLTDGADISAYPMIQAEMAATGYPMSTVVDMLIATEMGWRQLAARIEEARRRWKITVQNETDINLVLSYEIQALQLLNTL